VYTERKNTESKKKREKKILHIEVVYSWGKGNDGYRKESKKTQKNPQLRCRTKAKKRKKTGEKKLKKV